MLIKEIVSFPTQLIRVETTKIVAEKKADKVDKEINISGETKGSIITSSKGKSIINMNIGNDSFTIEIEMSGIFEFQEKIKNNEEAIVFLETQAIRILWSYVRENVYTISSKMLDHPIMLPTIDVIKTIEKAQ